MSAAFPGVRLFARASDSSPVTVDAPNVTAATIALILTVSLDHIALNQSYANDSSEQYLYATLPSSPALLPQGEGGKTRFQVPRPEGEGFRVRVSPRKQKAASLLGAASSK